MAHGIIRIQYSRWHFKKIKVLYLTQQGKKKSCSIITERLPYLVNHPPSTQRLFSFDSHKSFNQIPSLTWLNSHRHITIQLTLMFIRFLNQHSLRRRASWSHSVQRASTAHLYYPDWPVTDNWPGLAYPKSGRARGAQGWPSLRQRI